MEATNAVQTGAAAVLQKVLAQSADSNQKPPQVTNPPVNSATGDLPKAETGKLGTQINTMA